MTGWGNAVGLAKFPWTDISRARVKALWANGVSATNIAATFSAEHSRKVERGAVMGIIKRGKFESPMSKKNLRVQAGQSSRSNLEPRPSTPRKPAVKRDGPELPDITLPPVDGDAVLAFGKPCRLVDFGDSSCRWPVTEERPMLFCNAVQYEAKGVTYPYCVDHCRCAYRPYTRPADFGASLAR